jgi:hypothetical protein
MNKPSRSKSATKPLERSSIEAYSGIVIGIVLAVISINWWLRALLFLSLTFVCGDFIWRSPFSHRWPKRLKTIIVIGCAVYLFWVAKGNVSSAYEMERLPAEDRTYMTSRGALDPNGGVSFEDPGHPRLIGAPGAKVVVAGNRVMKFSKKYNVVSVCFQWDGKEDWRDVTNISKTQEAFDIVNGPIEMMIPWNDQYIKNLLNHQMGTTYVALLVPKGISPKNFNSVREAVNEGSLVLQSAGGPP